MQKSLIKVLIGLFFWIPVTAQNEFVLSGTVKDAASGEDLSGATIVVEGETGRGTVSNNYGFYSLPLRQGQYKIRFQFIGYEPVTIVVDLHGHVKKDIELHRVSIELGDVEVQAKQADRNITSVDMGKVQIQPKSLESLPVLFGEADVLKVLQLTAGVKPAGDGNAGFHVRGGGADQNLILLDEAPVYGASHLLGFFSVFNSEALNNVTLMKGIVPAEFGGRASSVLDIRMKEGNLKKTGITGEIGLISSKATVEGPIVKDQGSFILSGRRTYVDMFLGLSHNQDVRESKLFFYDLNLKTNLKINSRNRIYLSGYTGNDDLNYKNQFGFRWGNKVGTFRWNNIISGRLFSNTTVIYSNYSSNISLLRDYNVHFNTTIRDVNLKQDFTWNNNTGKMVRFGFNVIHHTILPGRVNFSEAYGIDQPHQVVDRKAIEGAVYVSQEQYVGEYLRVYYGARLTLFSNLGPGNFYEFDSNGELTNTLWIDNHSIYMTQGGIEPRVGFSLMPGKKSSIKASFNRMHQFLHLLGNTTTTTPTEIWLPSSNNVKPQIADQLSLGMYNNFASNNIETSVELYFKEMQNQIEYKNSAELAYKSTIESELTFGRGWAYGAEFTLRRNSGRITGWLSYTWSKTMRQFDGINNGKPFPAHYDRTHDFSAVMVVDITKRFKFSSTWVYYTGNAVTYPSGRYEIERKIVGYYTERNSFRMPDYHRLDVSLTIYGKDRKGFRSSWNFSIYNAYGRENAYYIDFRRKPDNPMEVEAVKVSLFKVIPSLSYKFRF